MYGSCHHIHHTVTSTPLHHHARIHGTRSSQSTRKQTPNFFVLQAVTYKYYTEATASVALVLNLVPIQKEIMTFVFLNSVSHHQAFQNLKTLVCSTEQNKP